MLLAKIDQKAPGNGTILTGGGGRQGGGQGFDGSLELLHQRMFQRSVAAEFHDALPGAAQRLPAVLQDLRNGAGSRTKQMAMNSRGFVDCGVAYFPLRWNEDAD